MEAPSFRSVWAKVKRAREHRDALQSYVAETFAVEANRPRVGAKFDSERGANVLYVNYMPDLDKFFVRAALILGDSVHCLRSALDHLAYQLAYRNRLGRSFDEREPMFPITTCPEKWKAARKNYLSQVPGDERAIIERYQGYHRIGEELSVGLYFHPLVMLDELDVTDKHRLLNTLIIPSSGWQSTTDAAFSITFFGIFDMIRDTFAGGGFEPVPIELNTVIARASFMEPLQAEVEMAGYVSPTVALDEGRSAIAVMDKIAATVVKVIREFEPFP